MTARELHDDMVVIDGLEIARWSRDVFAAMRDGGLTAVNCTCSVWEDFTPTMRNIAAFKRHLREHDDLIRPVRTVADIHAAKREGRVGIMLGFQNTAALENDLTCVELFGELGVRVIQMTYNTQNAVGSGCYESRDSGLSDFGREVLEEMNRLGIVADLSHVGSETSREVIEHSARPVVYSHVAPAALRPHPRTKSDEDLRLLADRGGLVGVCLLPAFLAAGNGATIDDYLEAIEYTIDVVGEEQVAIGTDFIEGHGREFLEWLMRDKGTSRVVTSDRIEELVEPQMLEGIERICEFPNLTTAMLGRGWSERRVRRVMGENWLRLFSDVWVEPEVTA